MLVEKSSLDEIRHFRDTTIKKFAKMFSSWLYKDYQAYLKSIKGKSNVKNFVKTFLVENQTVYIEFYPVYRKCNNVELGATRKTAVFSIYTYVETKRGKLRYSLDDLDEISIMTPHYLSRIDERILGNPIVLNTQTTIKYIRNGQEYELTCDNCRVIISKRIQKDIKVLVTCLHKDMCTGKNYQEIFKRIENKEDDSSINALIDEQDIYEWK